MRCVRRVQYLLTLLDVALLQSVLNGWPGGVPYSSGKQYA